MGSCSSRQAAPRSPPPPPAHPPMPEDIYRLSQIVPESEATFRIASAVPRPATARIIQVSTARTESARPFATVPSSETNLRGNISPDPEATRHAASPDPEATRRTVSPDPEATRRTVSPDPEATRHTVSPDPEATRRATNVSPLSESGRHYTTVVNEPEAAFRLSAMSPDLEVSQSVSTAVSDAFAERDTMLPTAQGAYGPFLIWCVEYKKGLYWKVEELPDNSCVLAATTDKQSASFMYLYPYDKGEDNETFRIGYHRFTEEYYGENYIRREELNGGKYVVEVDEPAACFLCAKSNTRWKNHLSMEYDSSNFHEFQIKLLAVPSVNGKFISSKQLNQRGTFFATAQSHSGQIGYVWIRRNTRNGDAEGPDTPHTTYQSGCKTTLERYRGNRKTIEFMHFKLLPVKKVRHVVLRGTR